MTFFKSCSGRGPGGLLGLLLGGFGWPFGSPLGRLWGLLAPLWGLWVPFGLLWALFGVPGSLLGCFVSPRVAWGGSFRLLWTFLVYSGVDMGTLGGPMGHFRQDVLISYTIAMIGELW